MNDLGFFAALEGKRFGGREGEREREREGERGNTVPTIIKLHVHAFSNYCNMYNM